MIRRYIDVDTNLFARLTKRKNEYDEYVIKGYENGRHNEDFDYYTDDWYDAVNTIKYMAKQYKGKLIQNGTTYTLYNDNTIKDSELKKFTKLQNEFLYEIKKYHYNFDEAYQAYLDNYKRLSEKQLNEVLSLVFKKGIYDSPKKRIKF